MPTLTLLIASVALADAINPSTIVPGLWLASTPRGHLVSFTVGVFAVYLTGGLVLVFGPGPALVSALHHVQGTIEHVVKATAGTIVLMIALGLWRSRHSQRKARLPQFAGTRRSAFTLGAGIMAIELPTAFIYFGAISAILAAHQSAVVNVSLLVAYNALFVAPLLVIHALRRFAGARAERWLCVGLGAAALVSGGVLGAIPLRRQTGRAGAEGDCAT